MGRWIAEECGKIVDETGAFLGRANSDEDAKNLCSDHKTDCDDYEKRIAELEALSSTKLASEIIVKMETDIQTLTAELARVKAESLRVVADGEPMKNYNVVRHKVVLYEGELWRASNIPYQLINVCDEETIDPPENATVQPVRRLERWETEE